MKHLAILASLFLAACGGGGDFTAAGPVTFNVTVEPGAITCNNCSVTLGPAGAASAAPRSAAAAPTAVYAAPPTPLTFTDPHAREREAIRAMLRIQGAADCFDVDAWDHVYLRRALRFDVLIVRATNQIVNAYLCAPST